MLQRLKKNYLLLVSTFLILYFFFNLLSGQRGLISYFEKKEILKNLQIEQEQIRKKIKDIELKNTLLSDKIDYDYIDMLIRDKLMLGKKGETTYIFKDNES